tara:strand:- start:180 stop:308 length:129 start_codon:yes stop_codon:yes gene_type:complete
MKNNHSNCKRKGNRRTTPVKAPIVLKKKDFEDLIFFCKKCPA